MPGFLERLGQLFGRGSSTPAAEETPAATDQVAAEPAPAESVPDTTATAEAAPAETAVATEAAPAPVESAAESPAATYSAPEPAMATPAAAAAPAQAAAPVEAAPAEVPAESAPAEAPVEAAATAAPAEAATEPTKSAEELEEERLWSEVHAAWAANDYETVTARLDTLRDLQPESAPEIDRTIASAQFNHAAQVEQSGDLERALYLYQEAQRRDPNLGEAAFAIERVQNQLAAAAQPAESVEAAAASSAQTYTVEAGDSLWAIAERFYGNGNEWGRILEANRDQIDNPDMIHPGQVLTIP
jgi:LysM repeat protein